MEQWSSIKEKGERWKTFKLIRYITMTWDLIVVIAMPIFLFLVTIVNVQHSCELRKKPCEKLLCYRENKRLQTEMRSFNRRINQADVKLQTEMHLFHHKINQLETELQMLQSYCTSFDKKVGENHDLELKKLQAEIQTFHQKLNNTENEIQKMQSNSTSSRKRTENKIIEVKEQRNSFGKLPFVFLLYMTFALLIWIDNKNVICRINIEKTKTLSNVPGVVYFNRHQLYHLKSLSNSFLGDRKFSLIREEKDLSEINSKLVFIFINFNDLDIILEAENDISQLKKCAVEVVENAGGKAVVIYQFHPDSREPEDGCLYSKNLATIHRHPILQRLSQEHCVLTIYKQFSEYQKTHLETLCREYASF